MMVKKLYFLRATTLSFLKILSFPALWRATFACVGTILNKFFILQAVAAKNRAKYPVSGVDHPLDDEIPFNPKWVDIYMDFTPCWVRAQASVLQLCGKRAVPLVKDFIDGIIGLYYSAAEVYTQNMSTTKRPRYLRCAKFRMIHLTDPHLMCIPSLHIIVVVYTYLKLREMVSHLGIDDVFPSDLLYKRVIAISESILYVKQHSVNCIPASMYAMSRLFPALFPPDAARRYLNDFFTDISADDAGVGSGFCEVPKELAAKIKAAIWSLYEEYLKDGGEGYWTAPLLRFLEGKRN
jgi:hypothetical protein